jgi:tetratricopeptide (TPR) repeat protein
MERDLAKAEAHHRRAVESAHRTLESVGPDDYAWWADMDTRPYMRSRQSLALILTEQARYAEAVAEYRALLALNPSDNQGMRYLVGPTLLHGGDVGAAVQAYDDYHSAYPDDSAEPDHAPLEGVARWLAGQHAKAVAAWWRALTGNLYVLPTVAGTPLPPTDLWHGSSDAVPEVAEEHLDRYEEIWERDTDARDALVRFLQHDLVRQRVERRVAWHRELDTLRSDTDDGLAGRQRLAQQLHTDSLSDAEARRIAQAIA